MHRLSAEIGRPVSFAMLQFDSRPDQWRELLEICRKTRERGANVVAQYASRPFGLLAGHQTEVNPFLNRPAYAEISQLPLAERVARLRDPAVRKRILGPERLEGLLCQTGELYPFTTQCQRLTESSQQFDSLLHALGFESRAPVPDEPALAIARARLVIGAKSHLAPSGSQPCPAWPPYGFPGTLP